MATSPSSTEVHRASDHHHHQRQRVALEKRDPDAGLTAALGSIVFATVMGVYHGTLHPSVPGGDSGELITEAWQLGLPHPPGYPLHSLLGHAAARVGVGTGHSVGWSLNLLSAVCSCSAAVLIYASILSLQGAELLRIAPVASYTGAVLGAFSFAFSPLVWTYSVTAEVFSLSNMFAAALVYAGTRYFDTQPRGSHGARVFCVAGAFLCGLGLSNQHALVFFVIPLGIVSLMYACNCSEVRASMFCVLACAAAFSFGLLPYIVYLPFATGQRGSWGDGTTLIGFFTHVLRREYGTFVLHPDMVSDEGVFERTMLYFHHLPGQIPLQIPFSPPTSLLHKWLSYSLLILGGFGAAWRSLAGLVVALLMLTYLLVFHALSNIDLSKSLTFAVHMRFWMQPNVIAMTWLGCGVCQLMRWIESSARFRHRQGVLALLVAAMLASGLSGVAHIRPAIDQSGNNVLQSYLGTVLESFPNGSLVLMRGDHVTNVMRYLQTCDGSRHDLHLINDQLVKARWFVKQEDKFPGIRFPERQYIKDVIFGFSLEQLIAVNFAHRPIYACDRFVSVHTAQAFEGVPHGFCERIVRKGEIKFKSWWPGAKDLLPWDLNFTAVLHGFGPESWEYKLYEKILEKQQTYIAFLVRLAQAESPANPELLKLVRIYAAKIVRQDLGPLQIQSATWKNMAVAHLTVKGALDSKRALRKGLRALCHYIVDPSETVQQDPQLEYIRSLIGTVVQALVSKFQTSSSDLLQLGWSPESRACAE